MDALKEENPRVSSRFHGDFFGCYDADFCPKERIFRPGVDGGEERP